MQDCTAQQAVEGLVPGLRREMTNHNGFRWIFVKDTK